MRPIKTVGIVCEGSTDFAVLRAVTKALVGADQFVLLQPDFDRLQVGTAGQPGPGWQGVRKFLQRSSGALGMGLYDLVIVQVDADLLALPEIERELTAENDDPPGGLDALCRHVKGWIDVSVLSLVLITLPRQSTGAWLVASHTRKKNVEGIPEPDEVLADAGLLERDARGRPLKEQAKYEGLAVALIAKLNDKQGISRTMPELARFVGKLDSKRRSAHAARGNGA